MRVADLHYELPKELIASYPAERRDGSRMLEVGRAGCQHRHTHELDRCLEPGSLVVVNDTRVMHARLVGRKASGGKAELLLVRRIEPGRWLTMIRTSKRVKAGLVLELDGGIGAQVTAVPNEEGLAEVALSPPVEGGRTVEELLAEVGHVPLPPYLGRAAEPADRDRYQTRFARELGAVAAPTAGLHFSDELIARIETSCEIAAVTLHVGPGTFKPVKVDDLDEHPMHTEEMVIDADVAARINTAKRSGKKVVAVGTTVVRALESAVDDDGVVQPTRGETKLLIQPGHRFRVIDALLTNFHLPGSTLLALVYAFGGMKRIRDAYQTAIAEGYRFYSYGDAMWIPSRGAA